MSSLTIIEDLDVFDNRSFCIGLGAPFGVVYPFELQCSKEAFCHGIVAAVPSATSYSRSAGYPAPPAQTRTCGFPASGSSVVLAFAQDKTIMRTPSGTTPP
jgi:hypothetical protein